MKNITIIKPTINDKDEINMLFELTITDTFNKHGYGQDVDELKKEIEIKKSLFLSHINSSEGSIFLIAKSNGKVAGTIYYGTADQLICDLSQNELAGIGEIGCVYIHPSYQKRGIGKRLLHSMYTALLDEGITEFVLESYYQEAQRVWTKLLGQPKIIAKNYWGEKEHHMIWYKLLSKKAVKSY